MWHYALSELLEEVYSCCESPDETTFLRMWLSGYTKAEIAAELGVSRFVILRMSKRIRQRCLERGNL